MHIGEWLHEGRLAAGLSVETATFRLRTVLPEAFWVSTKTVHRAEKDPDPNPVLAAGLARVYGKEPDDWPVELRDALDGVRKVLDPAVRRLLLESAARTAA
jgi:hypothetical protein